MLLHPSAASGGVLQCLDWPALTLALTEIRLLFPACRLAFSCYQSAPSMYERLDRFVAVSFTPTGALPAGAPHVIPLMPNEKRLSDAAPKLVKRGDAGGGR